MITREKCLEVCGYAPEDKAPFVMSEEELVIFVRYAVALGLEMAAKECEKERAALEQNREVWNKDPMFEPTEEYIADWESSACRGEEYATAIRKLAEEVQRG